MVKNLPEIIQSLKEDSTIPMGWEKYAISIANDAIDRLNMNGKFPFLRTVISIGDTADRSRRRLSGTGAMWLNEVRDLKFYEPYWYSEDDILTFKINQGISYRVYTKWGANNDKRELCRWSGLITDIPGGYYTEYLDFLLVSDANTSESGYGIYLDGYMMLSHFNVGINVEKQDYGPTQYIDFGLSEILNRPDILIKTMALIITERYSGDKIDVSAVPSSDANEPVPPVNPALDRRRGDYFAMIGHYRNIADEREIEGAMWNRFPIETQIQDEFYTDRYIGYDEGLDRRYRIR